MNDKDKIYFNACLYAIDKLVKKGSCRYSWKDNNGKWNSISWNEVLHWILEKLNAESDKLKADDELLDKIRAEIIENSIEDYKYHGCGTDELIIETSEVLRILDKYKKESEEKE